VKKALETQNDLMLQNTAGHEVTSVDRREPVGKFQMRLSFFTYCISLDLLKGSGYFHNFSKSFCVVITFNFVLKQKNKGTRKWAKQTKLHKKPKKFLFLLKYSKTR